MTEHEKRIREALLIAAINCPHEITDDRITLYFNAAKPGHNALNQLSTRLEEANSALLADLDAVRGASKRLVDAVNYKAAAMAGFADPEKIDFANECVWRAVDQTTRALKGATA